MDREGEPEDVEVDDSPVAVIGERLVEFQTVAELVAAMEWQEDAGEIPGDLVAQLELNRDRHLRSLSSDDWQRLRERTDEAARENGRAG